MSYQIVYSEESKQDLNDIYGYIAFELLVPDTAEAQVKRIMKAVRTLDNFPMRHSLWKDEPWQSMGIRFFPIDQYLIFYLPDEKRGTVSILRVMYKGRNINEQM